MIVEELDNIIRVVKALVDHAETKRFSTQVEPNHVVQYFFERQGATKVIEILEGIMNGNIQMKDYLNNE